MECRMCDHVVRGNTLEEKLNDLKMLSLSSDPYADGMLDRHDAYAWYNPWFGSSQVTSETPNQPDTTTDTNAPPNQLGTKTDPTPPPDNDTRISDLESTISSQNETILDL